MSHSEKIKNAQILRRLMIYVFKVNEETKQYIAYNRDYERVNTFNKETPKGFNNCIYLYDDDCRPYSNYKYKCKYYIKLDNALLKLKDYQQIY